MEAAALTLKALQEQVRKAVQCAFPYEVWVTAEIASIGENRTGHCYLELVDTDEQKRPVAKCSAKIWRNTYVTLAPRFASITGMPLQSGMKILALVMVELHPVYGYSLTISQIDPAYTLGDRQRRRRETLERLAREGIMEMNKELPFPYLPQRIAVVSSDTAAGYGDFMDQINRNPNRYAFSIQLFPALMQGDTAPRSIISALDAIYREQESFDVVVIIRGGGSTLDLDCFDDYDLAANIAQFPLPIITGIGHERDESVADIVAHTRVKTPTAAAALLIDIMVTAETTLDNLYEHFVTLVENAISEENARIVDLLTRLRQETNSTLQQHRFLLETYKQKTASLHRLVTTRQTAVLTRLEDRRTNALSRLFDRERQRLTLAEEKKDLLDPRRLLKRGYSITRIKTADGSFRTLTSASDLQSGDRLFTQLDAFEIESIVNHIASQETTQP